MIRVPFEGEKRSEDGSAGDGITGDGIAGDEITGDGITGDESTGSLCGRYELKLNPHNPALEQLSPLRGAEKPACNLPHPPRGPSVADLSARVPSRASSLTREARPAGIPRVKTPSVQSVHCLLC